MWLCRYPAPKLAVVSACLVSVSRRVGTCSLTSGVLLVILHLSHLHPRLDTNRLRNDCTTLNLKILLLYLDFTNLCASRLSLCSSTVAIPSSGDCDRARSSSSKQAHGITLITLPLQSDCFHDLLYLTLEQTRPHLRYGS
jgi:hypothetical protein